MGQAWAVVFCFGLFLGSAQSGPKTCPGIPNNNKVKRVSCRCCFVRRSWTLSVARHGPGPINTFASSVVPHVYVPQSMADTEFLTPARCGSESVPPARFTHWAGLDKPFLLFSFFSLFYILYCFASLFSFVK
jgi:hypothetical protein